MSEQMSEPSPASPPEVSSLPLVGSLLPMLQRPVRFFVDAAAEHGEVFRVRLPGGRVTVIAGEHVQELTATAVGRAARTGGTSLHTSRTRPSHLPRPEVPEHLRDTYTEDVNDCTADVLRNLEFLGVDYLVPIGGDDTLSYGQRLHEEGVHRLNQRRQVDLGLEQHAVHRGSLLDE